MLHGLQREPAFESLDLFKQTVFGLYDLCDVIKLTLIWPWFSCTPSGRFYRFARGDPIYLDHSLLSPDIFSCFEPLTEDGSYIRPWLGCSLCMTISRTVFDSDAQAAFVQIVILEINASEGWGLAAETSSNGSDAEFLKFFSPYQKKESIYVRSVTFQ